MGDDDSNCAKRRCGRQSDRQTDPRRRVICCFSYNLNDLSCHGVVYDRPMSDMSPTNQRALQHDAPNAVIEQRRSHQYLTRALCAFWDSPPLRV
jgi:hypothetical protein